MRLPVLLLSTLFLTAATPPVPDVLKPYIHGDRFDPGDYKWMKGRFPDATPEEKAQDQQIRDWQKASYMAALADTRAEFRALGVADPKLEGAPVGDMLYRQVSGFLDTSLWPSFAAFQTSLETAVPIADTYMMAVATAKQIGSAKSANLRALLTARPMGEQMLRYAGGWGEGEMANAPAVSEPVKAIILSRLMTAMTIEDHDNTEWLKRIVAAQGWPKRSQVGDDAAQDAWLLVQHADADPVFQFTVLRAMAPLLAAGEVSKGDYAYLYDRVMLKITGKQRYGTQAMCDNGKRLSQPLEDQGAVDRHRAEVGLGPVTAYLANMDAALGPCPPTGRF